MNEEIKVRGKRGDFNDYEAFINKFKAAKTTDECYTPQPIYDAVLDYVFEKGTLPRMPRLFAHSGLMGTTPQRSIPMAVWLSITHPLVSWRRLCDFM